MNTNIPNRKKRELVSNTLKSLSHPDRLSVLCHLINGERTVAELTDLCGVSQSAMSQFLSRMKREGFVTDRREGAFSYYRIKEDRIRKLMEALYEIFC